MNDNKKNSGIVDLIFLAVAYLVTIAAVFSTYYVHTESGIQIGAVSDRKYIANATTENVRETEKLRQAAMDAVGPVYVTDNDVMPRVLKELEDYFGLIENLRAEYNADEDMTLLSSYGEITSHKSITLTQTELKTLAELSVSEFSAFENEVTQLVTNVLESGVSDVDEALLKIKEDMYLSSIDNSLVGVSYDIVSGALENNVYIDEEATNAAKKAAADEVSPVLIQKNQKIIDENEIITEEAYYALEACGFIRDMDYGANLLPFGGKCILITIMFIGLLLYFLNFNRKRILGGNEGLLLFALYISLILLSFAASGLDYIFVPILGFLIIITLLLSTGIALIFIPIVTSVTMLVTGGDVGYFLYFIVSGHIMVLMICATKERGRAILNGFIASIAGGIIMLGIQILEGKPLRLMTFGQAALTAFITFIYVIIAVGSLPMWESVFGIVSDLRLSELINPNKTLIKRLMLEAPGTYHHSLLLANMAETAAYEIGANPILARVGAYYHDIGKLSNPGYFTENIANESPHDFMDPYTSARIIKEHISEGLELGKRYRLPAPIMNIIYEHHGTGLIKFFYYKAKNNKKSTREVREEDFRYPCRIPTSKEAAIIMIADTTEAAVRSLRSNNNEEQLKNLDGFIKNIIDEKMADGQLNDSGLTIKDIEIIHKTLLDTLKGMYHNRIAYPDDDKTDNADNADNTDKNENNTDNTGNTKNTKNTKNNDRK